MYNKNPFIGNILKEILPIDIRYMTMYISELPTDVLMNIQSYLLGSSKDLRLKHKKKFIELQRLFKITYSPFRIKDNNCLYSSYRIEGKMLKLDILLKQGERLEKMWQETYNRLRQNETFNSGFRPSYYSKSTELFIWVRTEDDSFENDLDINDGDDVDVDKFLQDTKMKFANEMRLNNAKSIISFSVFVWINY